MHLHIQIICVPGAPRHAWYEQPTTIHELLSKADIHCKSDTVYMLSGEGQPTRRNIKSSKLLNSRFDKLWVCRPDKAVGPRTSTESSSK